MLVLCSRFFINSEKEDKSVVEKIMKICNGGGKSVQIIINAKPESEFYLFEKYISLFDKYGIVAKLVDISKEKVNDKDVILLGGGSPRLLMQKIREFGSVDDIFENYKHTNLIIGQSAGAMVFYENFVDDVGNGKEFASFEGLGLIKSKENLLPHYEDLPTFDYGQRCLKFVEENKLFYKGLRNDEVLVLD